jgi:peptidoglycan/LPS O-acetylase OafA/YrhL
MTETDRRIDGLDVLRGFASLAVCWFHITSFHYNTPDQRFFHRLRETGTYGWLGVEVFFVISGFVIPYSLYRARYRLRDFFRYVARRVIRLDPPYLAAIALILVLEYVTSLKSGRPFMAEAEPVGWTRVLLHVGYLNIFTRYAWLNPSFWTLAIEIQYYLLMGLAFPLLVSRRPVIRLGTVAVMAASSVLARPLLTPAPYARFVPGFLCLFLFGILTFQLHVGRIRRAEYVTAMIVVAATSLVTLGRLPSLAGLGAVGVILAYRGQPSAVPAFLARISYSLYLLHWPVANHTLSIVGMKYLKAESDAARTLVLLITLGVCLASAYLLYIAVERPAQHWARRLHYGTSG